MLGLFFFLLPVHGAYFLGFICFCNIVLDCTNNAHWRLSEKRHFVTLQNIILSEVCIIVCKVSYSVLHISEGL